MLYFKIMLPLLNILLIKSKYTLNNLIFRGKFPIFNDRIIYSYKKYYFEIFRIKKLLLKFDRN